MSGQLDAGGNGGSDTDSSGSTSGSGSSSSSSSSSGSSGGVVDTVTDTVDDVVDTVTGSDSSSSTSSSGSSSSSSSSSSGGSGLAESVSNTVESGKKTVDNVRETAGNVRETVSKKVKSGRKTAANAVEKADAVADEITGDVARESQQAQRQAVDTAQDAGAEVVDALEASGRARARRAQARQQGTEAAADAASDYVAEADVKPGVAKDMTEGGFLSEETEGELQDAAQKVDSVKKTFDQNEPVTIAGSKLPERVLQGAADASVDLLNVPRHVQTVESATEIAQNTPGEVAEHGAGAVAETGTAVARETGEAIVQEAKNNPAHFAGGAIFEIATGAAIASKSEDVATAARAGWRKGRGDTEFQPNELTNQDTVDYYQGDTSKGDARFPGFRPEQGETVDETLRRQADQYTPEQIQQRFEQAGVEEGTPLKHGTQADHVGQDSFDVSPPGKSRPSDPDKAMFVGPEVSPNFAGATPDAGAIQRMKEELTSVRPRIPSLRGDPGKAAVTKMDVDTQPADVGDEAATGGSPMAPGDESDFLAQREGEATAFVRSPENRNMGEAEAVVPPGAEFQQLAREGFTRYGNDIVDVYTYKPKDAGDADAGTGETTTAADLDAETYSGGQDGTPYAPTPGGGVGATGSTSAAGQSGQGPESTTGDPSADLVMGTRRTTWADEATGDGGNTGGGSGTRSTGDSRRSGGRDSGPVDSGAPTSGSPSDRRRPPESGRPTDSGRPSESGAPSDSGRPPESGRPTSPGRPSESGGPESPGRPSWADYAQSEGRRPDTSPDSSRRQQRRRDRDDEERRENYAEPAPAAAPYRIGYRNPIASGASVLFGGAFPSGGAPATSTAESSTSSAAPELQGNGQAPELGELYSWFDGGRR